MRHGWHQNGGKGGRGQPQRVMGRQWQTWIKTSKHHGTIILYANEREVRWRIGAEGCFRGLASTQSNLETKAKAPGLSIYADSSYISSIRAQTLSKVLYSKYQPRTKI